MRFQYVLYISFDICLFYILHSTRIYHNHLYSSYTISYTCSFELFTKLVYSELLAILIIYLILNLTESIIDLNCVLLTDFIFYYYWKQFAVCVYMIVCFIQL